MQQRLVSLNTALDELEGIFAARNAHKSSAMQEFARRVLGANAQAPTDRLTNMVGTTLQSHTLRRMDISLSLCEKLAQAAAMTKMPALLQFACDEVEEANDQLKTLGDAYVIDQSKHERRATNARSHIDDLLDTAKPVPAPASKADIQKISSEIADLFCQSTSILIEEITLNMAFVGAVTANRGAGQSQADLLALRNGMRAVTQDLNRTRTQIRRAAIFTVLALAA